MSWRLVGKVGDVKIHYNSEYEEYRVRAPGGGDGYFTGDKKDAFDTANDMVKHGSYRNNPRKKRERAGSVRAVRSDFFVSVWEERDRLHIALKVGKEGEWDTTVVDWWDDDARSMFEDGFFKARDLENSVIAYAEEMGLIEVI